MFGGARRQIPQLSEGTGGCHPNTALRTQVNIRVRLRNNHYPALDRRGKTNAVSHLEVLNSHCFFTRSSWSVLRNSEQDSIRLPRKQFAQVQAVLCPWPGGGMMHSTHSPPPARQHSQVSSATSPATCTMTANMASSVAAAGSSLLSSLSLASSPPRQLSAR